jgi:hypothetical protein
MSLSEVEYSLRIRFRAPGYWVAECAMGWIQIPERNMPKAWKRWFETRLIRVGVNFVVLSQEMC